MDVRRLLRGLGKSSIAAGTLILLFVAYQLWGTGISEAHAQDRLRKQFQAATVAPSPTSTTAPATSPSTTTAPPPAATPPGSAVAIIQIPKIGVDSAVVQGVGVSDLQHGPGHYPNSPLPGQTGNAAIAGHRTTYGAPFYRLDELKAGDDIFVTTRDAPAPFHFKVLSSTSVSPNDVAVLDPTPDAELTLTTCTPRFTASKRLVVVSKLVGTVDPHPVVTTTVPPSLPSQVAAPIAGADDVGSLSGGTAPRTPAVLWGLVCAAIWLAAWAIGHRWRRWVTYIVATPVFLLCLFYFFQNFARFVPANI